MEFGSLDWYEMVFDTIRAIYLEELHREPDLPGLVNWFYHAREHGKDATWIREQVKASQEWTVVHTTPTIPKYTRDQLLKVRGALNIKMAAGPWGKRPFQSDNVVSTNFLWAYDDATAASIIQGYKDRGYTHCPLGPFVDPGYHGQFPAVDFRTDEVRTRIEASILKLYTAGLIPVFFLTPDGWTPEQLHTLDPIFQSSFWQEAVQILVNGYEQQGSKYGWSNATYCAHGDYFKSIFPNAVRGLHTVSKIEAPVGQGDDTSKPGMSLKECWGRVADRFDFWLYQDDMWDNADTHVDPNGDGRTDLEHFYDLWDKNNPSSFVRRFSQGGLWECSLIPMPGEFGAYGEYWFNHPEDKYRAIGKKCIELGAMGSFDGC